MCLEGIDEVRSRLTEVEKEVVTLQVLQGKITLSPSLLALVWAIALAMLGTAGASAVSAYQSRQALEKIEALTVEVRQHVASPGHPVALERTEDLRRRVESLEHGKK